jgi:hypothetical protein
MSRQPAGENIYVPDGAAPGGNGQGRSGPGGNGQGRSGPGGNGPGGNGQGGLGDGVVQERATVPRATSDAGEGYGGYPQSYQGQAVPAGPVGQERPYAPSAVHTIEGRSLGSALISDPESLRRRWESVQVGFVDDPRRAVGEAEEMVSTVIDDLVSGFRDERRALETQWAGGGAPSTDELRQAFQRYRDFFERLLRI